MKLVVEPVEQRSAVARFHRGARCTRVRFSNISVFERDAFYSRTRVRIVRVSLILSVAATSSEARIAPETIPPKDNACASFTRESRYPEDVHKQLRIETPLLRRAFHGGTKTWHKEARRVYHTVRGKEVGPRCKLRHCQGTDTPGVPERVESLAINNLGPNGETKRQIVHGVGEEEEEEKEEHEGISVRVPRIKPARFVRLSAAYTW